MTPPSPEPLLYERRGAIVVLTLNRPEKLNAVNVRMRDLLVDAWKRFENDPDARVAVLTGAGSRAFCAGRDLSEPSAEGQEAFLPMIGDSVHLTKPVIAAVNGLAYGAGWLLAQGCDLCVASEEASFALPEAKIGRGAAWACWLDGVLPQKVVLEVLMTGNALSARRAHELGFVNHVVAPNEVLARALQLAADIVAAAPLSVAASREMVYSTAGQGRTEALAQAFALFAPVYRSEDTQEGVRAFREKRPPAWTGR